MSEYLTYVGRANRRTPVETYEDLLGLPHVERPDDGAVILYAGHSGAYLHVGGGPGPVCSDCGRGVLRWAEGGYVAWWRICDVCGSHWDLHPIEWGPAKPSHPLMEKVGYRCGHDVERDDPQGTWCVECDDEADPIYRETPVQYTRWVQGRGEMPLELTEPLYDSGRTWGDLLALVTPEHWAEAEAHREQMAGMVVVPCCWARRARLY
jgi:hypothetical protein